MTKNSNLLQLFRVLLPSWKFFEDIGEVPLLYHRSGTAADSLGEWQPTLTSVRRKWWNLFFNSEGNIVHACHSLLNQLLQDLRDWDDKNIAEFEQSTSMQLTCALVRSKIKSFESNKNLFFQFKITTHLPLAKGNETDILMSAIYES